MPARNDLQKWALEMERFCAYQERSTYEIVVKLNRKKVGKEHINDIISHLKANNFLNEPRFVEAYVRGKCNIKGWGPHKIKAGLKAHKISEELIKSGLGNLKLTDQTQLLNAWLNKKRAALRNEPEGPKKTAKIIRFLLSKGFEMPAIMDLVKTS